MSKPIGNAGERNHRDILRYVWPDIEKHEDRYHPTDDHKNTGAYHVQSKKRATWNIKDVVRHMEKWLDWHIDPWFIMYEDRDRRKKDNPFDVYAIIPAGLLVEILLGLRVLDEGDGHTTDRSEHAEPPEQLDPTDFAVELVARVVAQLVDMSAVDPDLLKEKLAARLAH